MTERIIDFLDALVATVGAVDKRYCLVEKRADVNGTNIPYKYKGNGNYAVVNVDGGSVSYWRIVNSISFDVVDGNKAVKNLQATYPIRYVAMVRRDDINPLTFSQDVANVLEGRNKDLQTQLQAKNVNITVGSIDTDTVKIWGEEFTMPLTEPNYTRSMVMIDLTVTVIAARSCWESCDDFPDILQGFDWCDPSTYQRLTPAQITCLEGFLCGTCADATVQLNGTTVGTIASGDTESFTVNLDGSPSGSWDGTAWQVTSAPCADATIELNGVEMTTIPSGDTENILVLQSNDMTQVGSKQGTHWRIDDSAISINGSPVADVMAEDALDIDVIQDGLPVGSWNGSEWVVPSCQVIPTLSINVYSDAGFTNPITSADVGDTVYLKALPNDITPTEYFFTFEDVNGELFNVYQGANDNTSWVVEGYVGIGSIYAFATEDAAEPKEWVGNSIQFETAGDVDAQAFLTATGITDQTISDAITQLVVDLKTDGLWTKIHALYPFVGGTSTTHKFNLKDPQDLDSSFRMTFFGGITHDATGITGNGSNGYTNTNYNPLNEGLTNTSNAMFYAVGTNAAGGYDMGLSNTNHYSISRYGNSVYLFNNIGASVNLGTQSNSIGFYINTRESATNMRVYKDGALVGSNTTSTTGAFPNANFNMMSLDAQYSSKTYQLAGVSDGLTVADCANLTTINNTFQTALGR